MQEDTVLRSFRALPLSILRCSSNILRLRDTQCADSIIIEQCFPFKCPCCGLALSFFCKREAQPETVSIKSFPSNQSRNRRTKNCIVIIFLTAHPQPKRETKNARNRTGSEYRPLPPTVLYSQNPPACQAPAFIDKHMNVKGTQPRFSQTSASPTVCEVPPIDMESKKHQHEYRKLFPYLARPFQMRPAQLNSTIVKFFSYADLLLEASSKLLRANFFHYSKPVAQHGKKGQ